MMGAPGLVRRGGETWESINADSSLFVPHKYPVPHPFAFFLAKGWETTSLIRVSQRVAQVSLLRPGM